MKNFVVETNLGYFTGYGHPGEPTFKFSEEVNLAWREHYNIASSLADKLKERFDITSVNVKDIRRLSNG